VAFYASDCGDGDREMEMSIVSPLVGREISSACASVLTVIAVVNYRSDDASFSFVLLFATTWGFLADV